MEKNISPEKLKREMGARLKAAKEKSGLSWDELIVGLHGVSSHEAFKNYCVGRSFISIPNLLILGERLGCGHEYLLTGKEKSEAAPQNAGGTMVERVGELIIDQFKMANEQLKMANHMLKTKDREIEQLRSELDSYRN